MTKTPEELTADWEEGKLPADDYFIKLINNDITTGFFDGLDFSCCANFGIFQILAPIPTYEQVKAMQDQIADLSKKVEELKEKLTEKEKLIQSLGIDIDYLDTKKMILIVENNKILELLKECKNIVAHDLWSRAQFSDGQVVEKDDLLTRINAALGESEE